MTAIKFLLKYGHFFIAGMRHADSIDLMKRWANHDFKTPTVLTGTCSVTGVFWAINTENIMGIHGVNLEQAPAPGPGIQGGFPVQNNSGLPYR